MGGGSVERWVSPWQENSQQNRRPQIGPSRRNPTSLEPKTPIPTAPRKKAGPQLLQNQERRRASSRLHSPRSTSWAMVRAPAGYPPISPSTKAAAPAPPTPNQGIHPPGQGTGTEPSHPCFNEQVREHKKGKERGDEHIQTQRDALPGRFQALLWKSKQQASDAKQAGPFHQDPPDIPSWCTPRPTC